MAVILTAATDRIAFAVLGPTHARRFPMDAIPCSFRRRSEAEASAAD
jgi:hypothetical protein